MRVDRVMDLLELLKASGTTTVEKLADTLDVSRRTVLRDLATLRDRGWPILSDVGPGGGVFLDRDRGVAAVHLGVDEVVALWVAAQLSMVGGTLPFNRAARSALAKVLSSVPRERARTLKALTRRIVVGHAASPAVLMNLGQPPAELLTAFEQAFGGGWCLGISYVDRHGRASDRVVEPHGLLVETPAWYLLTRDTSHGEPRMFRMDRIRSVRVLRSRPFTADFDALARDYMAQRQREAQQRHARGAASKE